MTRKRAIRLARRWAEGGVNTLREGEAQEYHKLALEAFLAQEAQNQPWKWSKLRERSPTMHTIRYKGCVAQQDNKTGVVCVYKDGHLVAFHPCDKRLSGKELRGKVNHYLLRAAEMEVDSKCCQS